MGMCWAAFVQPTAAPGAKRPGIGLLFAVPADLIHKAISVIRGEAGFKEGDIIPEMDGQPALNPVQLKRAILIAAPGRQVEFAELEGKDR